MAAPDPDLQRLCNGVDTPVESSILFCFLSWMKSSVRCPFVPMELTVTGVISFGWIRPHLGWTSQEFFMLHLAQDL